MAKSRERSGGGGDDDRHAAHAAPSVWEWVAAGLGAAIVLAALAFMAYDAVTTGPHPIPKLAVHVDTVVAYPGGYVVEFRAINAGDATAAHVLIQGELRGDTGGVVERSESTIDFVPARSSRPGGLVFKTDPRRSRVEVRVVGFDRP